MDEQRARSLITTERTRVQRLLADMTKAEGADRTAENQAADMDDAAELLTSEGTDEAVIAALQLRMAALDRAERRLADGTFGLSVRSGRPIPDERLEADPAAELTIDEASQPQVGLGQGAGDWSVRTWDCAIAVN